MEGPGPRSHTSSEEDQGQPTPTAPYDKEGQYGPPPARGSSTACRPYVKNCKYGPPQHLAYCQQRTKKPKGQTTPQPRKHKGTGRTGTTGAVITVPQERERPKRRASNRVSRKKTTGQGRELIPRQGEQTLGEPVKTRQGTIQGNEE